MPPKPHLLHMSSASSSDLAAIKAKLHSPESERSFLGYFFLASDGIPRSELIDAANLLTPEDFYSRQHQVIFKATQELVAAGEPLDFGALSEKLRPFLNDKTVKATDLSKLLDCPVSSPDYYADIIRDYRRKRQLAELGERLKRAAHDGGQAEEILLRIRTVQEEAAEQGRGRDLGFRLIRVGDIKATAPNWLIRGLIEADTLSLIFGDPGCGKSFIGVDIACCIATGEGFHGLPVKQPGAVIYLAGEGQNGLGRRLMAWGIRRGVDLSNAPIFISSMPASLCDETQASQVISVVEALAAEHGAPSAIVVDTLARNFGPGDENSTRDMGAFVKACDQLRAQHQAAVLLIHHSGHGDKSRARGSMALKGALDAEYRLEKDAEGVCRFEATKMKDAELPQPMAFVIRTVELPIEGEDDRPVTSAILDETDYSPRADTNKAPRGKWQTVALEVLAAMQAEREESRVPLWDWRQACFDKDMKERTFYKVRGTLKELGLITEDDGFVS